MSLVFAKIKEELERDVPCMRGRVFFAPVDDEEVFDASLIGHEEELLLDPEKYFFPLLRKHVGPAFYESVSETEWLKVYESFCAGRLPGCFTIATEGEQYSLILAPKPEDLDLSVLLNAQGDRVFTDDIIAVTNAEDFGTFTANHELGHVLSHYFRTEYEVACIPNLYEDNFNESVSDAFALIRYIQKYGAMDAEFLEALKHMRRVNQEEGLISHATLRTIEYFKPCDFPRELVNGNMADAFAVALQVAQKTALTKLERAQLLVAQARGQKTEPGFELA